MLGVGSIPWSPLARGLLTRPSTTKSAREDTDPAIRMYSPESRSDIVMRYELNFLSTHQDRFTKLGIASSRLPSRMERVWRKSAWPGCFRRTVCCYFLRVVLRRVAVDETNYAGVSAPVVGTTSLKNLQDLVEGVHLKLTDDDIRSMEEAYKPQAIAGH
jgi:hypothetical protein